MSFRLALVTITFTPRQAHTKKHIYLWNAICQTSNTHIVFLLLAHNSMARWECKRFHNEVTEARVNLNMVCEFLKGSGNHIHRHAGNQDNVRTIRGREWQNVPGSSGKSLGSECNGAVLTAAASVSMFYNAGSPSISVCKVTNEILSIQHSFREARP